MAKTTAPLLSFGGSGQIGKTQVYSKWKGVSYARRYVIPANPNSTDQQLTRNVFKFASATIKLATPAIVEVWTAFAKGKPLTQRNAFMSANIKALRSMTDNDDAVFSNGANGGIVAAGIATAVAGKVITVTLTAPALPAGWSIIEAAAVAQLEQDPQTYTDARTYEATDSSSPYAPAITVQDAGVHVVSGWFKFDKGDGTFAYGAGVNTTATTT